MFQKGYISADTTLEDALPLVDWGQVKDGAAKKAITVGQILSMSSGMMAGCFSYGDQSTAEATLSAPFFISMNAGRFSYLCSGSILSYIIFQQTKKTPLAFAQEELFPALGLPSSISWNPAHGQDGIQESGHGLIMGPLDLAKLGQLYHQGGKTGSTSSVQLIPASFATDARTNALRIPYGTRRRKIPYMGVLRICQQPKRGTDTWFGYLVRAPAQ